MLVRPCPCGASGTQVSSSMAHSILVLDSQGEPCARSPTFLVASVCRHGPRPLPQSSPHLSILFHDCCYALGITTPPSVAALSPPALQITSSSCSAHGIRTHLVRDSAP